MERRLTAILAADVVGFSRLMGADEAGTLSALKAVRDELIDRKIAKHRGRIVKLTGDGILAEFPSVVGAIACATEVQRGMRERNADLPNGQRIEFRIGVNVGDVLSKATIFSATASTSRRASKPLPSRVESASRRSSTIRC
jgi:adenylate cyclase